MNKGCFGFVQMDYAGTNSFDAQLFWPSDTDVYGDDMATTAYQHNFYHDHKDYYKFPYRKVDPPASD